MATLELNLSPAARRLILQYAGAQNLDFESALECLVIEGMKSIRAGNPWAYPYVDKSV